MFYVCLIFLCIVLHSAPVITVETTTAVEDTTPLAITTTAPALPQSAAKLVRFRRQHPVIVKHVFRSSKRTKPRRRIKRPKIKYGPPNYSYGEPLTYYKPRFSHPPAEKPSFSLDEFQHLNIDSADFDLPPSSYEGQTMDLDFYSHSEPSSYDEHKPPSSEYIFDVEPEEPSKYSYSPPSKPEISSSHEPHRTYGVPKEFEYSTGYKSSMSDGPQYHEPPSESSYSEHPSNSYESPSNSYGPPSSSYESPSYKAPKISYEPPPSSYETPSYESPKSSYKPPTSSYESPSYESPKDSYKPPPSSYETPSYKTPKDSYKPPPSSYETPSYESPKDSYKQPPSSYETPSYASPKDSYKPPPSSYETPSYESPKDSYKPPPSSYETPSYESPKDSYKPPPSSYETPLYEAPKSSYKPPPSSYETPSHSYESPKGSYDSPKSSYEPPSNSYEPPSNTNQYHPSYSDSPPSGPAYKPPNDYGPPPLPHIPDAYSPPSHQPPPNNQGGNSVYEKKIPNTGYSSYANSGYGASSGHQSFAEPPSPTEHIEITYSPSYEINLPPSQSSHPSNNYQLPAPSNPHPGNFAEPPQHPPPTYQAPDHPVSPPEQSSHPRHPGGSSQVYSTPTQELPLNPHHKQPTYDYPKSSYEVPIYDPIPFEASTHDEQEFYPPQPYEFPTEHFGGQTHISQHEVTREENGIVTQFQPSEHRPTTTDQSGEVSDDTHSSGSSTTTGHSSQPPRRKRKRKRNRGSTTTTSASKHILDVPELAEAFEAGNQRQKYAQHGPDADVNESNHVEEQHNPKLIPSTLKPNYVSSNPWNPMRVRTSSTIKISTPAATTTTTVADKPQITSTYRSRPRGKFRPFTRERQPSTTEHVATSPTKQTSEKIAIISIEKSRSNSYYDGTIAPPALTVSNLYKNRLNRFRTPARPATSTALTTTTKAGQDLQPKRTTKSAFDTTHFKSPRNDKDVERKLSTIAHNLPKNHKLF